MDTSSQNDALASPWSEFAAARDQAAFCKTWLQLVCVQISGARAGLLLHDPSQSGDFVPAALWPDGKADLRYLAPVAERVLRDRRGIVVAGDGTPERMRHMPAHVGYPIEVDGTVHGVAVLDLGVVTDAQLAMALRQLHWASAWVIDRARSRKLADRDTQIARLSFATDMAGIALQEPSFRLTALAIVNHLSIALRCDRVSIGIRHGHRIEIEAISNAATFDRRMSLARLISAAMEDVLDHEAEIVHPARGTDDVTPGAHMLLAQTFGDVAICSIPLLQGNEISGVITLERDMAGGVAFDDDTVARGKAIGALLGPILTLKQENERSLIERLGSAPQRMAETLFGSRHPGAKLIVFVALLIGGGLAVAEGTYRVTARTFLEASVQRAVVAPFDGHISASKVRAGDIVQAGQLLVQLDDRDLALELQQQLSEREQGLRRERQALATGDRGAQAVTTAQIAQIDASIGLIRYKLERASLFAPFDGIVVSGDLDQLVGAPVEQGRMLFQVAPLGGFRVMMQIDERDIAAIAPQQQGELTLVGLPALRLPFTVQQITPVASQQDGNNFFRVEATLLDSTGQLRPGMEGVAKIDAGTRQLLWIWTHGLVDWARLWLWKMQP